MRDDPRRTQHTLARYGDGQAAMEHARSEHGARCPVCRGGRQWPSVPCNGKPAMPFQASEVSNCTAVSRVTVRSLESQ